MEETAPDVGQLYNTAGNTPQNNQSLHVDVYRRQADTYGTCTYMHPSFKWLLGRDRVPSTCSSLAAQTHTFSRQTDGVAHTYLYMHALSSPTKTYRCGKKDTHADTHTQFEVDEMMRANKDE